MTSRQLGCGDSIHSMCIITSSGHYIFTMCPTSCTGKARRQSSFAIAQQGADPTGHAMPWIPRDSAACPQASMACTTESTMHRGHEPTRMG
jgi:hypothetical protein